MTACRAGCLLAGAILVGWASGPASADEVPAAVARLFEVGWSITLQARQAADAQHEILQGIAPADSRASKAWWLVLMQQRRFDEALKEIQRYLEREPGDLAALRARAWLTTVLKNYTVAFVAADELSEQLARSVPKDDSDREIHDEYVAFLGRLLGYLGGAAADNVNQEERRRLEKRLLERLPEMQRPLFEEARDRVLAKFIEMTDESASVRERTKAASAAEKAKTLAELQAERETLDERAKDIDERKKKLNSELRSELTDIDKQEQPLVQQQAQLAARVEILATDLVGYSSQILTLEQLAARENDAVLRQQYLNQATSLSLVAGRIEADIFNANRLLRTVQNQRGALQSRRVQAQAGTASQIDKLNRELGELDRRERRTEGLERRAGRPSSAISGKERSLSAQAAALSTYDVFPLETEKARLLDALK